MGDAGGPGSARHAGPARRRRRPALTSVAARRLLAAETLAGVLVEKLDLVPPVPVEALLAERADVRKLYLEDAPEFDAVVHGLRGGRARPVVVLNSDRPPTRIRFTSAHEFGHLVLSWHVGTIECQVEEDVDREDALRAFEAEANAFAGRLLVPERFVAGLRHLGEADMIAGLAEADVSPDAGLRSLASLLPTGHVFVLMDGAGTGVASVYRSPGTDNPGVLRARPLDRDRLKRVFDRHGTARHLGRRVWWGAHEVRLDVPEGDTDWRGSLQAIVEDVAPGQGRSGALWKSASGVAGAAHGASRGSDVGEVAAKIRQRFLRRDDLQHVVGHPRFDEFVLARARAFLTPS